QLRQVQGGDTRDGEGVLPGNAVAVAGDREQPVLDEGAHRAGEVGDVALVEAGEDLRSAAGQQIGRDTRLAAPAALVVELPADDAQQSGLPLEGAQTREQGA